MSEKQKLHNNWVDNYNNPPVFIKKGEVGALLIHGFTANEKTMAEVGNIFVNNGITTLGVRLAGHGTTPDDLNDAVYQDWINSAEAGFKRLMTEVNEIYLVGYSFGGNLSFYLAQKYPDVVKGIISLGTPIYFKNKIWIKIALPFIKIFKKYIKKGKIDESKILREYYKETGSYTVIPLIALEQFFQFVQVSKKDLNKIYQPIFIAHSRLDPSIHYKSAAYIFNNITTPVEQKELFLFDDEFHIPISKESRDMIHDKIIKFIKK